MLALLDLALIVLGVLAIIFVITQVIVPFVDGTPLFPMLGKSAYALEIERAEQELEEIAEREKLKAANDEINRRKAELEKK